MSFHEWPLADRLFLILAEPYHWCRITVSSEKHHDIFNIHFEYYVKDPTKMKSHNSGY